MHTTPVSLLERLRLPASQEAWNHFVNLYTPVLYGWAVRKLGLADADAADLVQDVLLLLLEKLPHFQYDPDRRFRGWLWTVLVNKCREQHRRRSPVIQSLPSEKLDALAGPHEQSALEEQEYRQQLVRRALQLMQADFEPTTWKACWAHLVQDRSAAEVGAELGLSVGAVRAAKFRVLCRLRAELQGLLD